jgi:hypothetical protein
MSVASSTADRRLDEEARRDTTAGGKRRAFVAGAARPDANTKRTYFGRYFGDRTLNEAKLRKRLGVGQVRFAGDADLAAAGSVPGFIGPVGIVAPVLVGTFIGGQRDAEGLANRRVSRHAALPVDLRQKSRDAR